LIARVSRETALQQELAVINPVRPARTPHQFPGQGWSLAAILFVEGLGIASLRS
jgi:hypothetical protein